ncbi:hypothetical protein SLS60_007070 [Paraconiothyrium brasiliense]|uniref:Uncharacterized protein n=1 Tax=Paraconiothyrium brasiliense TaxID=300254 RepID=A0ABR3R8L3_9PLEO
MSQTPAPNPDQKEQHLSVDFDKLAIPRGRASSVSAQTIIAENPEFEARKAAIKRRQTHVAVVKVTWWQCFKAALFGPKSLSRKLAATVELAEVEDTHAEFFDDRVNCYILTVSAYKHNSREYIPARCVLDTGCSQGNIISTKFARRLGFTENDYQPLDHREDNGGMVATGEIHKVLGFVRVSWFSETSPKVFNTMRFLVSETAHVDLVVGTRSIIKEKIINPPNLMADKEIHDLTKKSGEPPTTPEFSSRPLTHTDPPRESLVNKVAELETDVIDAEEASADAKEGTKERLSAEKKLKKVNNALKVARWKLALYDVDLDLKKKNTERTQGALIERKKGLETQLAGASKKGK